MKTSHKFATSPDGLGAKGKNFSSNVTSPDRGHFGIASARELGRVLNLNQSIN